MAHSVESLGNVKEHCTYVLLGVEGLIPLVKAMEEKSLGRVGRAESRLKRVEQVVGVEML